MQKKVLNKNLNRGILFHQVMEVYYRNMKEGASHKDATGMAAEDLKVLMLQALVENADNVEVELEVSELSKQYFEFYGDESKTFRILEVEKELYMDTPVEGVTYGMMLDLLVEFIAGPYMGQVVLMDHKTVYNFYTDVQLAMNAQAPKYIATLRANDYPVNNYIFNQIRHRTTVENKADPGKRFQRVAVTPSDTKIRNIMMDQFTAAERIQAFERQTTAEQERGALRVLNPLVCNNCGYSDLCHTRLIGESASVLLAMDYEPRFERYGLPKIEVVYDE